MSSLTDRLSAASRDRGISSSVNMDAISADGQRRKSVSSTPDAFADLKAQVHTKLLQQLGPKLYDADLTQSELEGMVRATLQEVMAGDETTIITTADRARLVQESAD